MNFAKGLALGAAGCAAGCLVTGFLVAMALTIAVSACVAVVPLAVLNTYGESVEIELDDEPSDQVLETIVRRVYEAEPMAGSRGFRLWVRDGRRVWIAMGGLSGGEARRRVEGALRELENEGKIAPGSARIVGFVKHTPGAFRFRFDDGQGAVEYRGLDSGPSKR